MIRNIEGTDVKVIELGKGDINVGNVIRKGEVRSSGIIFSNEDISDIAKSNAVIMEIDSNKGIIEYLYAMVKFLETHISNDDDSKAINDLLKYMNKLIKELEE